MHGNSTANSAISVHTLKQKGKNAREPTTPTQRKQMVTSSTTNQDLTSSTTDQDLLQSQAC